MAGIFGIGAQWIEERCQAARGNIKNTPLRFEENRALPYGGVLMVLPFLLETGLLSYQNHYQEFETGYYDLDFVILLLAFMYLCRIKNPEQLKHISPGDYGKLLGVDRIPEAKCLRKKLKVICEQNQSGPWNMALTRQWSSADDNDFYYIDGHVQVYHGYQGQLGKKHVSRQKLCLPGMQEFWVNDPMGMPYFYVTGEVNEKLQEVLVSSIIPTLLQEITPKYSEEELNQDPDLPRFTIVFDREAYSPDLFKKLWDTYRIAVITYRKNVQDYWGDEDFTTHKISMEGVSMEMELARREVTINGEVFQEVRRKTKDAHQTSVLTTNRKLTITMVAVYMFARWNQENFFRYMRQDYDFDRLLQYAVDQIDSDFLVVNPAYNKLSYKLKKIREKINRRKASLYSMIEENVEEALEKTPATLVKQTNEKEELDQLLKEEKTLIKERKETGYRIKIKDMPEEVRYNKLHQESKYFQNIIKMICYRAETSFALMLSEDYKKSINEKRALAKNVINTSIDLKVDYANNTLQVNLYSQATPRDNMAVEQLCEKLNQLETKYPGTDLTLNFKITT